MPDQNDPVATPKGAHWAQPSTEQCQDRLGAKMALDPDTGAPTVIACEGMLMAVREVRSLSFGVDGPDSVVSLGAGMDTDPEILQRQIDQFKRGWLLRIAILAARPHASGHDSRGLTFDTEAEAIRAAHAARAACAYAVASEARRLGVSP